MYLKFPIRKYFVFLLFSIVLSVSLDFGCSGFAFRCLSYQFQFSYLCHRRHCWIFPSLDNSPAPNHGIGTSCRLFDSAKNNLPMLYSQLSSCATLSALFVDLTIARYSAYTITGLSPRTTSAAQARQTGILAYLVLAIMLTVALTAGIFAVIAALKSEKSKSPNRPQFKTTLPHSHNLRFAILSPLS